MRSPLLYLSMGAGLALVASLAVAADRRIEGTVKAVDGEKSTITLATKAGVAAKDETLDVIKKAKITVNGQAAALKDVRRGQKAVAIFNTELEVVTKLDATGEGVVPLVPEVTTLNELPDPDGFRAGPWPSPDGLTLYWQSRPAGSSGQIWIWGARRASKDALFEDAKRLVPGQDPAVTADGLEMILLQDGSLWVTTRPSTEAAFARPQKVAELQGHGHLSAPCFSGEDLVLYATRFGPGQPLQPVKFTRVDRRAKWVGPTPVRLILPAGKGARYFFVTRDGSRAFCDLLDVDAEHPGGKVDRTELAMMRAEGEGFGRPEIIRIDGEPLLGVFPRYVAATNELFFVQAGGGPPPRILLVRNFDPDAIETAPSAAAKPARPDREAIQGEWVAVSEQLGGKPFTSEQMKQMNKRLSVKGDRFVIRRTGLGGKFGVYDGAIRLDPSADPKAFDWKGKGPDGAAQEWRGIYQLDADILRLCYVDASSGEPRPTELLAREGSKRRLSVFKKEGK